MALPRRGSSGVVIQLCASEKLLNERHDAVPGARARTSVQSRRVVSISSRLPSQGEQLGLAVVLDGEPAALGRGLEAA